MSQKIDKDVINLDKAFSQPADQLIGHIRIHWLNRFGEKLTTKEIEKIAIEVLKERIHGQIRR